MFFHRPATLILTGLALAVIMAGCTDSVHFSSLDDAAASADVSPDAAMYVDEFHVIAPRRAPDARIELVSIEHEAAGWRVVRVSQGRAGEQAVSVQVDEPVAGSGWGGTYLFGTAGPGMARMTTDRDDERGGVVVDGLWVLVLDTSGVDPRTLGWRFLDESGAPVQIGTGLLPPN